MPVIVRRCVRCGTTDRNVAWDSIDGAVAAGAPDAGWACPTCAWPEAQLVDEEPVDVDARESVAALARGRAEATSSGPGPDEKRTGPIGDAVRLLGAEDLFRTGR